MKARDLIIPYFKAHRWTIGVGLASLIVVDFMQLMIPLVIKWAVDDLTLLRADLTVLLGHAGTIAGIAVLIGVLRYVWRRCLLGTARHLEAALRDRLLGHIQTLSPSFFDRTQTGDLMAHATNDIQQVRMAAGMGLVALNDAILLGAAAIGFMLYIHAQLTLYVLIPMPFIVIGTRLMGRRMYYRYQKVQAAFADLTEALRERCAGIRMIKAHNGEPAARQEVGQVSRAYADENMKLVGVTGVFFPFMILLTNMSLAIVLYFGGRRTILAEITPGDLVAFISYLGLLSWPMMALGWVTNLIQRGGASLERLKQILQRTPDIRDRHGARPLPAPRGRVAFEQVTFAYDGDERRAVLADITLEVAPGEILGVVGPPGCGKSTLLSLLPRLYEVTRGRVTVDGRDVRDVALADLRRHIACVPQEPFMFAGTVRDNILFGCQERCHGALDGAIDDAGLRETLAHLPAQGWIRWWARRGCCFPAGKNSASPWHVRCSSMRPSSCWTTPSARWTPPPPRSSWRRCAAWPDAKPSWWRPTVWSAVRFADTIVSLQAGRQVEAGSHDQLHRRQRLLCPGARAAGAGSCGLITVMRRRTIWASPATCACSNACCPCCGRLPAPSDWHRWPWWSR
jgi:ATP-binding cassette, subfamily B, multidrug efflux pump